ncbi:MAG: inositol monophosphatase family protein [Candidatus Helarchaeota archaeon]
MNIEWQTFCEKLTDNIWKAVKPLVGTANAGQRILRYHKKTKKIDACAEDVVINYLREKHLDIALYSEEIGEITFGTAPQYSMILDPIDGTSNSLRGLPFFSTSIAIAKGSRVEDIIFGYIRNYLTGEIFFGDQTGAYFNKTRMKSSTNRPLNQTLVSLYSYNSVNLQLIKKILRKIRKMRLLGAVSLELAYVGCQKLDGLIDLRGDLLVSDIAAGMWIVQQAGGVVTDADGKVISGKIDITQGYSLIATGNKVLHQEFLNIIKQK